MSSIEDRIERVLYTQEELDGRVRELGGRIARDLRGSAPVMVCVLRGACVFFADLVRAVDLPVELDFMAVSSYGDSSVSSGSLRVLKDLSTDIRGRDVVVVEDILDTGLTLGRITEMLRARGPRSLSTAVLLRKKPDAHADYVGFECPLEFVVGYGLDYAQSYRNLPYIGVLKPSAIA